MPQHTEELYKRTYDYIQRNPSCSYRDIIEYIMAREYLYEGKCLENLLYWSVNDLIDRGMIMLDEREYKNTSTGRVERIITFSVKPNYTQTLTSKKDDFVKEIGGFLSPETCKIMDGFIAERIQREKGQEDECNSVWEDEGTISPKGAKKIDDLITERIKEETREKKMRLRKIIEGYEVDLMNVYTTKTTIVDILHSLIEEEAENLDTELLSEKEAGEFLARVKERAEEIYHMDIQELLEAITRE